MALSPKMMIGVLIAVVFFFALIPTIATEQAAAVANANITGGASTLIGLTVLIIVAVFILSIYKGK